MHSLVGLPGASARRSSGRNPTVLAFHGFGGVPLEIEVACEAAEELGLATYAPVLPGHGTVPSDLAPLRFADLLRGAIAAFEEVKKNGPVIIVGLSLGSMLATELTLRSPRDVLALGILGNAFWFRRPFPGTALEIAVGLGVPDFGFPKIASDLGDPEAAKTHVTYHIQPLRTAASIQEAGARLAPRLRGVNCPTLILHGALDAVCPAENASKVATRLGTHDRRVVILPRSRHILTRDVEREVVRAELKQFFSRFVA